MFSTHPLSAGWQGYGLFLLETLLILGLIAVVAWAVVRFGRHRPGAAKGARRMRILERLPLEPRRALYLVEVDGAALLLGASDGSVRLIKELDPAAGATPEPSEREG
jgi:flagellar protein FliO/FliZ